jgi:hypothetical protein
MLENRSLTVEFSYGTGLAWGSAKRHYNTLFAFPVKENVKESLKSQAAIMLHIFTNRLQRRCATYEFMRIMPRARDGKSSGTTAASSAQVRRWSRLKSERKQLLAGGGLISGKGGDP